ncbi:hypothetical protein ARC78_00455 [Stenotrophomonas pictorum JCM 9942]|uniref:Uncharacterized protein n=1 Tax=Stenotrophomonas pictorum JCM 9942 TaxID=1236960 RepID=A0A0R0AXH4_9GAMM|nr:hypothetical protein [Stenotrophomonas pictorum]KRG45464.1 hypothetical protein ARC78_00455 [Stenotrophomonas pictorum JCM 9942]
MDSNVHRYQCIAAFALLVAMPVTVMASGARQGVKAQPGEMVLLRDVSARMAYRPAPPGMALIAEPSPKREVGTALGVSIGMDELSDDEYAAMGSGLTQAAPHQTTVERVSATAVTGTLGRATGDGGVLSGNQLGQAIGGPMGAVSGATRGIGDQVRSAFAQFPLGQPAGSGPGGK